MSENNDEQSSPEVDEESTDGNDNGEEMTDEELMAALEESELSEADFEIEDDEILDPSQVTVDEGENGSNEDEGSIFDSEGDLEEILSAMEEVEKEEKKTVAETIAAIESGEQDREEVLADISDELASKIKDELDQREDEEEENFVTEEDFITHSQKSLSKTWYHALYFLAFNSEDGEATKKVLYEALKEVLSKSPIDPIPEHMFNFGLSPLLNIQLYEKPVVSFKRGNFKLNFGRKKLQEILLKVGRPLSKRPVITKKEQKKMISDFLKDDFIDSF